MPLLPLTLLAFAIAISAVHPHVVGRKSNNQISFENMKEQATQVRSRESSQYAGESME